MSTERDELATIREAHWVTENLNLGQYRTKFVCVCGADWVHDGHDPEQVPGPELFEQHVADAILAAGYRKPRTITTAAELDALGFEAVILDGCGTPHVCDRFRTDGKRAEWKPSGMDHLLESDDVLFHGPATVLHSPAVTA